MAWTAQWHINYLKIKQGQGAKLMLTCGNFPSYMYLSYSVPALKYIYTLKVHPVNVIH